MIERKRSSSGGVRSWVNPMSDKLLGTSDQVDQSVCFALARGPRVKAFSVHKAIHEKVRVIGEFVDRRARQNTKKRKDERPHPSALSCPTLALHRRQKLCV